MQNHFRADDRLSILRASDQFRKWNSLDDKRFCILCDKTFTGRQIDIRRRRGHFELHCPTEGCNSGAHQWVYPGNPLTSEKVYQDWWRALSADKEYLPPGPAKTSLKLRHA